MTFYFRPAGDFKFYPCKEAEVSKCFLHICEIGTGEPAEWDTVTTYLRKHPGCVRGAPSGQFVYLIDD